jgi:hypothetical protein
MSATTPLAARLRMTKARSDHDALRESMEEHDRLAAMRKEERRVEKAARGAHDRTDTTGSFGADHVDGDADLEGDDSDEASLEEGELDGLDRPLLKKKNTLGDRTAGELTLLKTDVSLIDRMHCHSKCA